MALMRFAGAGLTRTGAGAPILQGLEFDIEPGDILAVLGGCGSGKTTLACWMAGWVPSGLPARVTGMAQFDGAPLVGRHAANLAAQVQLVQANPYAALTGCAFSVEGEVAFGPENLGWPEADIRQSVRTALELCEATGLAARRPATLSGGEAQRVALAAALAMRPRLLLLDEAFSRMAPAVAQRLLGRLADLAHQGLALVLFDKRFDIAAQVASRVLLLEQGRPLLLDSPEAAFDEALDLVHASDALRAARRMRSAGLWPSAVPPPLMVGTAPSRFQEALSG